MDTYSYTGQTKYKILGEQLKSQKTSYRNIKCSTKRNDLGDNMHDATGNIPQIWPWYKT